MLSADPVKEIANQEYSNTPTRPHYHGRGSIPAGGEQRTNDEGNDGGNATVRQRGRLRNLSVGFRFRFRFRVRFLMHITRRGLDAGQEDSAPAGGVELTDAFWTE